SQQDEEQRDLAAGVNNRMRQEEEEHHQQQEEEDALAVAQNGGISSSDEGDLDGDDYDDDMMDRISRSPSIEDGAYCYYRPRRLPLRGSEALPGPSSPGSPQTPTCHSRAPTDPRTKMMTATTPSSTILATVTLAGRPNA